MPDVIGYLTMPLSHLTYVPVITIGCLDVVIVRCLGCAVEDNLEIVLTNKQRQHYLDRHPEMSAVEAYLHLSVLDPDEVHRSQYDIDVAIFYREVVDSAGKYVSVAVRIQLSANEKKHSILSFRFARQTEIEKGRTRGLSVWRKDHDELPGGSANPHISSDPGE